MTLLQLTAETSKLKQNLTAAQSQLRDFGKACQGLGRDMMALGGALSLPFILAEKSFAGFDDKMRLVQAVISSTGDQFDQLTKTAQHLGRETSFTAQQVADAMIGLGRMGFNPSEIVSAIDNVLNLSRATGTDLAESADIAANSLRIFGLEVGVESVDASGILRKMAAVMRDIAVATAKMPTAERLSFMKDVFDVRGMMSGISLSGNIDEMDKFLARLKDVTGTADETARALSFGRLSW